MIDNQRVIVCAAINRTGDSRSVTHRDRVVPGVTIDVSADRLPRCNVKLVVAAHAAQRASQARIDIEDVDTAPAAKIFNA